MMVEPYEVQIPPSSGFPWQVVGKALAYALLTAWALVLVVPLLWMFLCAFVPNAGLQHTPPVIRMSELTLRNFVALYERSHGHLFRWLFNTLVVASVVTAGSTFLSALAGFCFARLRFPGRGLLFWLFLATLMVPVQAIVLPLFVVVNNLLELVDSLWAIILPQLAAPMGVFLCRQYMSSMPTDLEDSARIDGCSELGVFSRVVLPLSKPVLAALAIFIFIFNWTNFFWPLVILRSPSQFMLEVGLAYIQDTSIMNSGVVMAGAAVGAVPMILFFMLFQKQLVAGLTVAPPRA